MIAICIGHSRLGDKGAVSVAGEFEWGFNSDVGWMVQERIYEARVPTLLIDDYPRRGYTAAMTWLGGILREARATACVELHFNWAGQTAHGHEWLCWHRSPAGKRLAEILRDTHQVANPDQVARHDPRVGKVRGLWSKSSGNGAGFLRLTPCPAVIAEPFFGSNPREWERFGSLHGRAALADTLAAGLVEWWRLR